MDRHSEPLGLLEASGRKSWHEVTEVWAVWCLNMFELMDWFPRSTQHPAWTHAACSILQHHVGIMQHCVDQCRFNAASPDSKVPWLLLLWQCCWMLWTSTRKARRWTEKLFRPMWLTRSWKGVAWCSIAQQCATYHTFCHIHHHFWSLFSLHSVSHILGHRNRYRTERGLVGGIQSADIRRVMMVITRLAHGPPTISALLDCWILPVFEKPNRWISCFVHCKWHKIKIDQDLYTNSW